MDDLRDTIFDVWRKSVNGDTDVVENYIWSNDLVAISKLLIGKDQRNEWTVALLVSVLVSFCLRIEDDAKVIEVIGLLRKIIPLVADQDCYRHLSQTERTKLERLSQDAPHFPTLNALAKLFTEK